VRLKISMADIAQSFIAQSRSLLMTAYLPRIERCLENLSDEEIWWRPREEANSIGNLLLHLSGNVRQWIVSGVGARPDTRVRQEEFDERGQRTRAELWQRLAETLAEADAVLAATEPHQLLETRRIQGKDATVLEAVYHVVEHFSMHTGQIILLTKMLTAKDLRFYDFSSGAPVETWHAPKRESSA
jgi:uncharacterized damage-inducible protein DinB